VAAPIQPIMKPSFAAAPPVQSRAALSVNERFAAARGTYVHTGGELNASAITFDSRSANVSLFHMNDGRVRADTLTVADAGRAEVLHSGGKIEAKQLAMAVQPGSEGRYTLSNAAVLKADTQTIGDAGNATFNHVNGTNDAITVNLARQPGSVSSYTIHGGTLNARNFRVGINGRGEFLHDGGTTTIRAYTRDRAGHWTFVKPEDGDVPGLVLGEGRNGHGDSVVKGGTLDSDSVFVAYRGEASFHLDGGTAQASTVVLGSADQAEANFTATRGKFVFGTIDARPVATSWREYLMEREGLFTGSASEVHSTLAAGKAENVFIVGNGGDAIVRLGDSRSTATITEAAPKLFTPIIVGATPSARSTIVGHGLVNLSGPFVQNGQVIADGYDRLGRVLDFSAVATVENTIDNPPDGENGYYAQRGASLKLKSLPIRGDGPYNWGESQTDPLPDLVNSVRFGFEGVKQPGKVDVSLIAPDSVEAQTKNDPPAGQTFVGLWQLDDEKVSPSTIDLLIRYDAAAVENMGANEGDLKLWAYTDDGRWISLADERRSLDVDANLIGGTFDGRIAYFGVAVAEFGNMMRIQSLAEPAITIEYAADAAQVVAGSASTGRSAVPEPAGAAVLGTVAAGALMARRRR
jgi:hypothetical protein